MGSKKTIKGKSKKKNAYVPISLVMVIDTYEKDINKELRKNNSKKRCPSAVAGEILAEVVMEEPKLLKKAREKVKKRYTGGKKKKR